jgi:hypothetical protein
MPQIPIALDLDGSLRNLDGVRRLDLSAWQERIRFGCGWRTWRAFARFLEPLLPPEPGPVFLGSGDFHHLTHLLLSRRPADDPVKVVVLDNHPDNMRFPFGIHCGSWVAHAARLPSVACIHVLGITSGDVSLAHAWENHLLPLYRGKVRYWTFGVAVGWARRIGLGTAVRSFDSAAALCEAFLDTVGRDREPVYFSLDKDVLDPSVVRTNWDQGRFTVESLEAIIRGLSGRLVGSDVTGEVSSHRYRSGWKRFLSALDGQETPPEEELARWQARQLELDRLLLTLLSEAAR